MTISPLSSAVPGVPGLKDSPDKIKDAASQFEALLMGQIMKAAQQEKGDGWGGEDTDSAAATAMDFANDYFARALASTGGLGLSKMIVEGLSRQNARHSNPATQSEPSENTPPIDR